jgi:hypothetical protein
MKPQERRASVPPWGKAAFETIACLASFVERLAEICVLPGPVGPRASFSQEKADLVDMLLVRKTNFAGFGDQSIVVQLDFPWDGESIVHLGTETQGRCTCTTIVIIVLLVHLNNVRVVKALAPAIHREVHASGQSDNVDGDDVIVRRRGNSLANVEVREVTGARALGC